MDLVHIRWLQIRQTESLQAIIRENVELKQSIIKLKEQHKSELASAKKAAINTDTRDKLKFIVRAFSIGFKSELLKIQQSLVHELEKNNNEKNKIHNAHYKLLDVISGKEKDLISSRQERDTLIAEVNQLRKAASDKESSLKGDFISLNGLIEKLKKDLKDAQKDKIALQNSLDSEMMRYKDLHSVKSDLDAKNELLVKKMEELNNEVSRAHEFTKSSLLRAKEASEIMAVNYSNTIKDLQNENECLRRAVLQLEDKVAKLSESLVGNKSHFAKYVKVKSENVALQSTVEEMMKQMNRNDRNFPSPMIGVTDGPELPPLLPRHRAGSDRR